MFTVPIDERVTEEANCRLQAVFGNERTFARIKSDTIEARTASALIRIQSASVLIGSIVFYGGKHSKVYLLGDVKDAHLQGSLAWKILKCF